MVNEFGDKEKSHVETKELNEEKWSLPSPIDRLAAHVVDGVILTPLAGLFLAFVKSRIVIAQIIGSGAEVEFYLYFYFFGFIFLHIIYHTVFTSISATTPGKYFFSLTVNDIWGNNFGENGNKLFWQKAFVRSVFWWIGLLFIFPLFAIFSNERRRPIHDRISDSLVVTNKVFKDDRPSKIEIGLGRGSVSALIGFVMLLLVFFIKTSFTEIEGKTIASLGNSKTGCSDVSNLLKTESNEMQTFFIEDAIVLYLSERIDGKCLEKEADYALWSGKSGDKVSVKQRELSYFAKFLIYKEHDSKSSKYSDKICGYDFTSIFCKVSLFTSEESKEAIDIYQGVNEDSKVIYKLMAINEYLESGYLGLAENLIDSFFNKFEGTFAEDSVYKSYLFTKKVSVLLAQGKTSRAESLLNYTSLGHQNPSMQKMNSQICYNQSREKCDKVKRNVSCNKFKNYLTANNEKPIETLEALTYFNVKSCFSEKAEFPPVMIKDQGTEKYLSDLALLHGKKERDDYLYSVFLGRKGGENGSDNEESNSQKSNELVNKYNDEIRIDSGRRILKGSDSEKDIRAVFLAWKKIKNKKWNWFLLGEEIFKKHSSLNQKSSMAEVHSELLSWQPSLLINKTRMIKEFFARGDHQKAWDLIPKGGRQPASVVESKIKDIKNFLKESESK